jgi:hypothetical protein
MTDQRPAQWLVLIGVIALLVRSAPLIWAADTSAPQLQAPRAVLCEAAGRSTTVHLDRCDRPALLSWPLARSEANAKPLRILVCLSGGPCPLDDGAPLTLASNQSQAPRTMFTWEIDSQHPEMPRNVAGAVATLGRRLAALELFWRLGESNKTAPALIELNQKAPLDPLSFGTCEQVKVGAVTIDNLRTEIQSDCPMAVRRATEAAIGERSLVEATSVGFDWRLPATFHEPAQSATIRIDLFPFESRPIVPGSPAGVLRPVGDASANREFLAMGKLDLRLPIVNDENRDEDPPAGASTWMGAILNLVLLVAGIALGLVGPPMLRQWQKGRGDGNPGGGGEQSRPLAPGGDAHAGDGEEDRSGQTAEGRLPIGRNVVPPPPPPNAPSSVKPVSKMLEQQHADVVALLKGLPQVIREDLARITTRNADQLRDIVFGPADHKPPAMSDGTPPLALTIPETAVERPNVAEQARPLVRAMYDMATFAATLRRAMWRRRPDQRAVPTSVGLSDEAPPDEFRWLYDALYDPRISEPLRESLRSDIDAVCRCLFAMEVDRAHLAWWLGLREYRWWKFRDNWPQPSSREQVEKLVREWAPLRLPPLQTLIEALPRELRSAGGTFSRLLSAAMAESGRLLPEDGDLPEAGHSAASQHFHELAAKLYDQIRAVYLPITLYRDDTDVKEVRQFRASTQSGWGYKLSADLIQAGTIATPRSELIVRISRPLVRLRNETSKSGFEWDGQLEFLQLGDQK